MVFGSFQTLINRRRCLEFALSTAAAFCAARAHPTFADSDAAFDVSQYAGKVVYLDFWASWCGPCQQSFPWMNSLQASYKTKGLSIVAVNLDRDRARAQTFLASYLPEFRVIFDPAGSLASKYDIKAMPTSIVFDRRGAARFTHAGFHPEDVAAYESQIGTLLNETPSR